MLAMKFTGKLILYALIAAAGTSYVIYRKIKSALDKSSVYELINALKKGSANAKEVAESLDIPYGMRENFSSEDFGKLKAAFKSASKIGDYSILYHSEVDTWHYLLITEILFSDFDIGVTGQSTDVNKRAYHSFVLRFEPDKKALSVWSELYVDTTSKFQKETFSRGIINH
jgi:hypothetical protein